MNENEMGCWLFFIFFFLFSIILLHIIKKNSLSHTKIRSHSGHSFSLSPALYVSHLLFYFTFVTKLFRNITRIYYSIIFSMVWCISARRVSGPAKIRRMENDKIAFYLNSVIILKNLYMK